MAKARELIAVRAKNSDGYLDGIPGALGNMPAETTIHCSY